MSLLGADKPLFFDRLRVADTSDRRARREAPPTSSVQHDWGDVMRTEAGDEYRACRRCGVRTHWDLASAGCAGFFLRSRPKKKGRG